MEKVILVLEDSPSCQLLIASSLRRIAEVKIVSSIKEAKEFLTSQLADLIIIDIGLPDGNGLEFFGEIQSHLAEKAIPAIIVSGDNDISRKVAAFSNGALDYIVKPYSPLELRARVERIIRDSQSTSTVMFKKIGLELNTDLLKAFDVTGYNKSEISLTPNEFRILSLLVKNLGRIYSRQQIIDRVWGTATFITPRTVDTHISSLRKKIIKLPLVVQSVRGEGYKFEERLRNLK